MVRGLRGSRGILAFATSSLQRTFETVSGVRSWPHWCCSRRRAFCLFAGSSASISPGVAILPAAFVTDVGLFALAAVPMLIAESTLSAYLWVCGAIVGGFLLAAVVMAFRPEREVVEEAGFALSDRGGIMWVPFALLVAALANIARTTAPSVFGDIWIYLSWVREYLGGDRLASVEPFFGSEVGLSRARINGWLLEQAAVSRASGVDPIDLVFTYLNPVLVIMAFLVFFALARILFKSERAALLSGCLYALFFFFHLSQSRIAWGGEFVQRLPEDKLVAKFLFLPLALACAYAFLEGGKKRYFIGFAFLCSAVMAVHPIGLAIIRIPMAGFAVLHLAAVPRSRDVWASVSAMGLAGITIIAVPAAIVSLFSDEPLSNVLADSGINSGDPDVLRNMIFVSPERNRIHEFADSSCVVPNPRSSSTPLSPPLSSSVSRSCSGAWGEAFAARLLLGTLYVTLVVVYVPPITTFPRRQRRAPRPDKRLSMAHTSRRGADAWLVAVDGNWLRSGLDATFPPDTPGRRCVAGPARSGSDDGRIAACAPGHGVDREAQGGEPEGRLLPFGSHLSLVPRRDTCTRSGAGPRPTERPHSRLLRRCERGKPQG